ncbi:hypothetical protein LCDV1gp064 [Lymphocystis disease virus 1]|uniref:hypothetical protein n=1 Tax=Fish lymphocystis disease virus TaxID=36363 RepID=UPI0000161EDF|nr:hypothetical protein LCDV1gp064 [Lymphocystis disease virus 1]
MKKIVNTTNLLLTNNHNFPLLFISSRPLIPGFFSLQQQSQLHDLLLWNIYSLDHERIGVVILQPKFQTLYWDTMGLAEYKTVDKLTFALGQFNYKSVNFFPRYLDYRIAAIHNINHETFTTVNKWKDADLMLQYTSSESDSTESSDCSNLWSFTDADLWSFSDTE